MDRRKFIFGLAGLGVLALAVGAMFTLAMVDEVQETETLKSKEKIANRVVSKVEQVADAATHRIETAPERGFLGRRIYRERVDLPTLERGKYWLTFLFPENWESDPESVLLRSYFATDGGDSRLVEMRNSTCRVNNYSLLEAKQRDKWLKYVGTNAPMIVLQEPGGRMVFKCSKGNIPETADELVERIQAAVDATKEKPIASEEKPAPKQQPSYQPEYFRGRGWRRAETEAPVVATLANYVTYGNVEELNGFRRRCTPPAPVEPVPPVDTPDFDTPIDPLPDTPVDEEADTKQFDDPVWLVILMGISGAVVGVVLGRKRR